MITLPNLPFAKNALEPYISEKTLEFHYGKHHQAYVDNLNKLIAGTELENESLENIIAASVNNPDKAGIFNNAAQIFNHTFFWNSLQASGDSSEIPAELLEMLNRDFGSLENFYTEFKAAAISQFGSGWAWLVLEDDKLKIVKTANAQMPDPTKQKMLLNLDVWEHAYYLDYQNKRADFIDAVLSNLLNWNFAKQNLV